MTDVDQNQDEARSAAEAGSESRAGSRAGAQNTVRTDVEVEAEPPFGDAAAAALSGTLADFAPAMALANLLICSTQSLGQTMLDMPSRTQSESIVRLATTARAAQQLLSGPQPQPQPEPAARRARQQPDDRDAACTCSDQGG